MILFLARQYLFHTFAITALISIVPVVAGFPIAGVLSGALFWAGLFSVIYTWRFIKARHIWPLFDNLGLPKLWLLIGFFLLLQLANLSLNRLL